MNRDIFIGELTSRRYANFIWPSILMMVVLSLYYTIDTIFVARFIGEEGLAALNIVYPIQGFGWGFAVMLASGASALVSIALGKGRQREADEKFTLTCAFSVVLGLIFAVVCVIFMNPIVNILGATEVLTQDCKIFLSMYVWGIPVAFVGVAFEFFIRSDGHPTFTILLYIAGGVVHLVLDILFMGPMHMGLAGAALANILGLLATALVGLYYFCCRGQNLHFRRFPVNWKHIGHSFVNGLPEFVNESSAGIMVFCYNLVVIGIAGEIGVASVAVVLQMHYLFMSVHMGYQVGCMPLISFYYGAQEFEKINRIMRYTRNYIVATSLLLGGVLLFGAPLIAWVYAPPGDELYELSVTGLRLVSISLFFVGINVFVSGFFTCFGNGLLSSTISLSRGLVMLLIGLFVLSRLFGLTGAWLALPFADFTTLALSFGMLNRYKGRYHYKILG
ncbi:MAG: MATE family efflux transporter [Bacillota bacterium]|nr:MATE family efflux transporter [Bacillota bacterium]